MENYYKSIDGSYALEIVNGKLERTLIAYDRNSHANKWVILAENCRLPADDSYKNEQVNDTIIINYYDRTRIVFTQKRFLASLTAAPPIIIEEHWNRC